MTLALSFSLCCVTRPNNLAAMETGFKLLADGWRQMKATIEVFLILLSSPQTVGPCADTWMLVLQYHLTSGIYVSKFQLKPRKCQSKQREAAWESGEGAAFGTRVWVSWTMPSPPRTKHTGKLTWLPKTGNFFGVFFARCSYCLYHWVKQCNKNETFSLNAFIKITSWFWSKTTGATFNLLCLLFGDLVHRGAQRHSNLSGNPDRAYKRRCLFFLGIFKMPQVQNIRKSL